MTQQDDDGNTIRRAVCLTCITLLIFSGTLPAGPEKNAKIAVVAESDLAADTGALISLFEVRLSETPGLELLERGRIESILREHELSLANLIERDSVIEAGKLLRTDAFLLLSRETVGEEGPVSTALLRVRFVEAAHGIRLLDTFEPIDASEHLQVVKRIAAKVAFASQKLAVPPEECTALGIVDIYRVGLADRHVRLAQILPAMLSARLSREPRVIMLEREDLKLLSREKQLTEGEDEDFLNSAVLIDGYLRRNEQTDSLEMALRFRNAAGREIGNCAVPIDPDAPASAVNTAVAIILEQVQTESAAGSWDPAAEAEEFYRLGKLLKAHGQYPAAMPLLETAHALQPQNMYYTWELFDNAWVIRFPARWYENKGSLGQPCYYSDVELAGVVSLLVRQMQAEYDNGALSAELLVKRLAVPLGLDSNKFNYFANPVSASSEQIRAINRSNRRIFVEILNKAAEGRYAYLLNDVVWLSSDDPSELMANIRAVYAKEIMPAHLGGRARDLGERLGTCYSALCHPGHVLTVWQGPYTFTRKATPEYAAFKSLWLGYLEEVAEIDDPVLKILGNLALAQEKTTYIGWTGSDRPPVDVAGGRVHCVRAMEALFGELGYPDEPIDEDEKRSLREWVRLTIEQVWYKDPEIVDVFAGIFGPFIESGDAVNIASWSLYTSYNLHSVLRHVIDDREAVAKYAALLERIVKVLETRKDHERVRRMLQRIGDDFAEIRTKYPDLLGPSGSHDFTTTIVLSKSDWPAAPPYEYVDAHVAGDRLLVAFNRYTTLSLAFAVIDLPRRRLLFQQRVGCHMGTMVIENGGGKRVNGSLAGLVAIGRKAYVGVRDIGLVEFDLTDSHSKARIFTAQDGLPSVSITGLAAVEGRVWIAYGGAAADSGLVIFDPARQSCQTVLCSSLKTDDIFNSGQPYVISSMVHGPNRQLLFLVGERGPDANFAYPLTEYWGLWKMDTETRALKQLWQNDVKRRGWERIDVCGDTWWLSNEFELIRFDPVLEKGALVGSRTSILRESRPMFEVTVDPFITDADLGESAFGHRTLGMIDTRTLAVHGDQMWARQGLGQIIVIHKGTSLKEAKVVSNDILDGDPVLRFVSTPYGLVALGAGTVGIIAVGDDQSKGAPVSVDTSGFSLTGKPGPK